MALVIKSEVIARYASVARPLMRGLGMAANSCVGAAGVTLATLKLFGIEGVAVPVSMIFMFPDQNYIYTAGLQPSERQHMKARAGQFIEREEPNGWRGHLVVIADGHLIDCSLDQATSEPHGVVIPSETLVIHLGDDARAVKRGRKTIHTTLTFDNGYSAMLTYMPLRDRRWESSDAWSDEAIPLMAELIRRSMADVRTEVR